MEPGADPPAFAPDDWEAAVDQWDSPAEVEATFRIQRRIALTYGVVFLAVTFAVPILTVTVPWWTDARLVGGMSPAFLMAAVGLYAFFLAIGLLASLLADAVEHRMLGPGDTDLEPDP